MYEVYIAPEAHRNSDSLPPRIRGRVTEAIHSLAQDPRPPGSRRLQRVGGYRLRVGDYRILYTVDDELRRVTVLRVRL
ncbi:MAG: type II toxin-antitoxin system RelE/ParE family toxin [Dehalococcoidia bacterium]